MGQTACMTVTQGFTAPGFDSVREAFEANFTHHGEVGAAFSAYHQGKIVADLWGGVADQESGAAWNEDTMILVFSTTKGVTAIIDLHTHAQVEQLPGQLGITAGFISDPPAWAGAAIFLWQLRPPAARPSPENRRPVSTAIAGASI